MEDLNNDLLQAAAEDGNSPIEAEPLPKRNTKDDLIRKIVDLCNDQNLELQHSNTKLRRMTKTQLTELLAEKIEKGMIAGMCDQVGVDRGSDARLIGLGALRMVHDICAGVCEKGANQFLPKYGYEVVGFCDSLKEPHVKEAVDSCLAEIAAESDVLQYVKSPYTRLGIAWMGAAVASVRKSRHNNRRIRNYEYLDDEYEHAPDLGPRQVRFAHPVERRPNRRPAPREEHGGRGPAETKCV